MKYDHFYQIADLLIQITAYIPMAEDRALLPFRAEKAKSEPDIQYEIHKADILPPDHESIYFGKNGLKIYFENESMAQYFLMKRNGRRCYARLTAETLPNHYCLMADDGFTQMFCEEGKVYTYLGIEKALLKFAAFYLHSSFVKWRNTGIVFSAPSGTGKSTQASLWEKFRGAEIINGDRTVLRKKDGRFFAYGSPYAGSSRIWKNESAPLKAIILLSQGPENVIRPAEKREAIRRLFPEILVNSWNPDFMEKVMSLLDCLIRTVPIYSMSCRPDEGAVELVEKTLF